METKALVNDWIVQYGRRTGKYFHLGNNGVFAVKDDQGQEYVIDIPNNSENVYFCAPIALLNDVNTKALGMEWGLKLNLWGQKTQGGTLSFEDSTNRIVFHKIFVIQKLDESAFIDEFNVFIQDVDNIKQMWHEYLQGINHTIQDVNPMLMFRI